MDDGDNDDTDDDDTDDDTDDDRDDDDADDDADQMTIYVVQRNVQEFCPLFRRIRKLIS